MKNGRLLLITAGFFLIPPLLWADVQWLQYRTSDHAREIVGGGSQHIRLEKESPTGIKLPELNTDTPRFLKWKTTMDSAGFRWGVLDRKHKYGLYDILYIDSDGDGQLDDEQKYEGRQTDQYQIQFGQIPIYFKGDDGLITYHLNLQFYSYNEQSTHVYVYTGCWYEGSVLIGGQETRCLLVDYNCNGTFDDKSESFNSDRIKIGPEESEQEGYVGNFLEIKDTLYRLNVAKDGAFVELMAAPDVAYGTVDMPETITSFAAGGMNGMFNRTVQNGKITLPEGDYRVYSWDIARKDDNGVEWRLTGQWFPNKQGFTVKKDAAANLDVGEPVFSKLDASLNEEGIYSFNQQLVGKMGEQISLTKAGRRTEAPKVHLRDKTGEYDRTFALEYG